MPDIEIKGKITVDSSTSAKSISDLKKEIKETQKALHDAKIGSSDYTAAQERLSAVQKQLKSATDESGAAFSMLKEKIGALPGGLQAIETGTSGVNAMFKVLAANPLILVITAIVAVFKLLYDAFTATDEGAQKVTAVFDGVGAVVREVFERVAKFASAVYKFFTGDFKGAMEDGKAAVTGFGDACVDSFKRGRDASNMLDEVADNARVLDIQYAALNARLAKSKELLTDETASLKDKRKALKETGEAMTSYYKDKLANDNKELTAIGMKYNIEGALQTLRDKGFEAGAKQFDETLQGLALGADKMREIEDLVKKVIATGEEADAFKRQQNRTVNALNKQEDGEAKQRADEAKARAKEAADKAKENRRNLMDYRIGIAKKEQEIELALMKDGQQKDLTILKNKFDDERLANERSLQEGKINATQKAELNLLAEKAYQIQRQDIINKYQQQEKAKEKDFRMGLNKIRIEIELAGIEDLRVKEKRQLEISFEEKFKQAREKHKENAARLRAEQITLKIQLAQSLIAIDKKHENEDNKSVRATTLRRIAFESSQAAGDIRRRKRLLAEKQSIIEAQYQEEINAAGITAARKYEIEQTYVENLQGLSEAKKSIDDSELDAKMKTTQAIGGILSNLSNLVGAQTSAGKALAVAASLIDTYAAITATLRSAAKTPQGSIPGYAIGQAVATGIAGFAAVKNILRVQVPNGGGGGVSIPSSSPLSASAPLSPQNSSTSLSQSTINGIGNAAQSGTNRAFVLDSDISNNAERTRRITRAARLS